MIHSKTWRSHPNPTSMQACILYLVDGLQFPKEDFLQILADFKWNTGNVRYFINLQGYLTYTPRKMLEYAESCKEIKGTLPAHKGENPFH
eukprot:11944847-Ditylum_brightwellii.AAC.1